MMTHLDTFLGHFLSPPLPRPPISRSLSPSPNNLSIHFRHLPLIQKPQTPEHFQPHPHDSKSDAVCGPGEFWLRHAPTSTSSPRWPAPKRTRTHAIRLYPSSRSHTTSLLASKPAAWPVLPTAGESGPGGDRGRGSTASPGAMWSGRLDTRAPSLGQAADRLSPRLRPAG